MKFIIPATAFKQINETEFEVDFTPKKVIDHCNKLAGDGYTAVYLEFHTYTADSPVVSRVRLYNNSVRGGEDHATIEAALAEFERNAGPTAYQVKAEQLRKEAAELESLAEKMKGGAQ